MSEEIKPNIYRDTRFNPHNIHFKELGLEDDLNKAIKLLDKIYEYDKSHPASAESLVTYSHSLSVGNLMYESAKRNGFTEYKAAQCYLAGLLHDIGKTEIDKDIINKSTKFTKEERVIVDEHATRSSQILEREGFSPLICEMAQMHHLKHPDEDQIKDGLKAEAFYPTDMNGRLNKNREFYKDDNIPKKLQIIYECDVYDALVSDRPYKKGMSLAKTFALLQDGPTSKDELEAFEKQQLDFVKQQSQEFVITSGDRDAVNAINGLSENMKKTLYNELNDITSSVNRSQERYRLNIAVSDNTEPSITISSVRGQKIAVIGEDHEKDRITGEESMKIRNAEFIDGIKHGVVENGDKGLENDREDIDEDIEYIAL